MEAISRKRFQETYHSYWNCPGVVGGLCRLCILSENIKYFGAAQSTCSRRQNTAWYKQISMEHSSVRYVKQCWCLTFSSSKNVPNSTVMISHNYHSEQIYSIIQVIYIHIYLSEFRAGKFLSLCNKVIQMEFVAIMKLSGSQEL